MFVTVTLNILLAVAGLGFGLFAWAASASWGPEGPIGAFLIPIPFLFLLLVVLTVCIRQGRFDWIPGGKPVAFILLVGLLVAVVATLFASWEPSRTTWQWMMAVVPFVTLLGCFWAINGLDPLHPARHAQLLTAMLLGLAAIGGWGFMGYALVMHIRGELETAAQQARRDRAVNDARAAEDLAKFRALPADTPLTAFFHFEFSDNPAVEKEARERIANWPNLDDELIKILSNETMPLPHMSWAISYIANLYPAPPARLAPAYAHVLERAYQYWESTMKYDEYAAKSEPEVRMFMRGAAKIQQAGGDLRPQLQAWYDLVKPARGLGGLAAYIKRVIDGKPS